MTVHMINPGISTLCERIASWVLRFSFKMGFGLRGFGGFQQYSISVSKCRVVDGSGLKCSKGRFGLLLFLIHFQQKSAEFSVTCNGSSGNRQLSKLSRACGLHVTARDLPHAQSFASISTTSPGTTHYQKDLSLKHNREEGTRVS